MGLKLQESGTVLPGYGDTHELEGPSHPMLLSQGAQAKLGFKKSSRHGTIEMEDKSLINEVAIELPDNHTVKIDEHYRDEEGRL